MRKCEVLVLRLKGRRRTIAKHYPREALCSHVFDTVNAFVPELLPGDCNEYGVCQNERYSVREEDCGMAVSCWRRFKQVLPYEQLCRNEHT